jgi:hypothetical protein
MTLAEIIVQLRARPSQDVPFAGAALSGSKRGASYAAAKAGTLGVEVYWSGGKLRTASIAIARVLGIEDKVAPAKTDQQADAPPMAAVAPTRQVATPQPAPARSRKSPAPKAMSARKPQRRKASRVAAE